MFLYAILLLTFVDEAVSGRQPEVTTTYGVVRGKAVRVPRGRAVDVFLGIPYATPPVGPLRWKLPEPPTPWMDPLETVTNKPLCPQVISTTSYLAQSHPGFNDFSEDCLTLNVYRPRVSKMNLPVMVFFHGGSYQIAGSIPFNGHFLASKEVVVVVPQYRLGILGFMKVIDNSVPSNLGLFDQKLALEFVQNNIAQFGGDPSRVTIMGESAGGFSVGLHMVSPLTRGLFAKAIIHSGPELNQFATSTAVNRPHLMPISVATKLGCDVTTTAAMVTCLSNKPWADLVQTAPDPYPGMSPLGYTPFAGGPNNPFLPLRPLDARLSRQVAPVPLLIGTMANDGAFFIGGVAPEAFTPGSEGFDRSKYEEILYRVVNQNFPAVPASNREALFQALRLVYTNWPHQDDPALNRDSINKLLTDGLFATPTDILAKLHAPLAPTYMYVSDYVSSSPSGILPTWMGATHSGLVPHMFGYPWLTKQIREETGIQNDRDWTKTDRHISDYMITLLTNFVKTGNPTPKPVRNKVSRKTTTWPQFDNTDLRYLEVNAGSNEVKSLYRQMFSEVWTNYLQWISRQT